MKKPILLFFLLKICLCGMAQIKPHKDIDLSFIAKHRDTIILKNKKLDTIFKNQIEAALLYYPELRDARIIFKVKRSLSPLSARPSIWAMFQKPKNRRYIVVISTKTIHKLEPILLKNLSFNAQIGVLGHELSHVADYHQRKGIYFIKLLFSQPFKKAMDKFENATDKRCIEHGLGYQLLAWSTEVRQNLNIKQWHGANNPDNTEGVHERYMSPQSIEKAMIKLDMYDD